MKMSVELLDIAELDLQAAKVLHENELYPQSIFYFQQSVEKANKAFALMTKLVTEDQLLRDIRHEPIRIYEKVIIKQKNKFEQFEGHLRIIPGFKEINILKNIDVNNYLKQFDIFLSDIEEIKQDRNDLINMSFTDIRRILREIEFNRKNSEKQMRRISKIRVTERDWNKQKTNMIELYNVFSKYNPVQVEKEKKNLDNINIEQIEEYIKRYFEFIYFVTFISTPLYYLSIITLPHSTVTRYPQNDLTPVNIYTKKLPIVKKLPVLSEIQGRALKELKILNKRIEDLNVTK
ncbi:MAG: HEPN domain-containing protein [Candidatus Methanoperedens sp.]|nr:HEPN domain-containing protein [Candidatus Methanoperedens sp.]